MRLVTVGPKYQVVLPKEVRKKLKNLKPGEKVKVYFQDENTVVVKTSPSNWIEETRGLAKKYWKKIDPIKELNKMRDEW